MKKIVLAIVLILMLSVPCWSATALYFKASNEVLILSESNYSFDEYIAPGIAVIENVECPDGFTARGPDYQLRVLGFSKILDGTTVRNATQAEIDTFQASEINSRKQRQANIAKKHLEKDPKLRRIMTAFAAIIVSEINILRNEHGLPERTLQQLKTAIKNRINKDD